MGSVWLTSVGLTEGKELEWEDGNENRPQSTLTTKLLEPYQTSYGSWLNIWLAILRMNVLERRGGR